MITIPLTQGKTAEISDEDDRLAKAYVWCAVCIRGIWYAATRISHPAGGFYIGPDKARRRRTTSLYLHQLIMGAKYVDHIDGSGLNNQRSNLRIATPSQNGANSRIPSNNTSGFKGVSWNTAKQRWRATIQHDGLKRHLGYFDDPILAAIRYDNTARELFGPFARPNFEWSSDESRFPEDELVTS